MTRKSDTSENWDLEERTRLEQQLLARRRSRVGAISIQTQIKRGDQLTLSSAQQRLWFIHALDPSNATYNVSQCYRLRGPLDAGALRAALEDVVDRHETLRSTFPVIRRVPHVSVEPGVFSGLSVIEFPTERSRDREAEAMEIIENEANAPFDLSLGPLFRATLLTLNPTDHFLLFVLHHIVCDEWSLRNLYQEIGEAYRAHSIGTEPDLPKLPMQYSDFALWQREQLSSGANEESRCYWQTALKGVSENFTIPYDGVAQTERQPGMHRHSWLISPDLVEDLGRLGQEVGATPFMTMLAAFLIVLRGWVGSEDIVVGTPTADRRHAEFENLIGFFANTLILRVTATGDPSFREFLRQVRNRVLEGIDHQDLPFDQVVETLNPARRNMGNPFFKVMFTHRNAIPLKFAAPGLRITQIELHRQQPKSDLWLAVKDGEDGRWATLVSDTRLYDQSTIESVAEDLNRVLRQVVSAGDTRLSALCAELAGPVRRKRFATSQSPDVDVRAQSLTAEPPHELNEIEAQARRMLDIWRRVLRTQNVSAEDDFFALGGHSMLVLELFAEIDREFGVSLPLSVLFEAPTMSALVRRIQETPDPAVVKLVVPMQPLGEKTPVFAVPSGGSSVLMYRSLVRCLGTDRPFYGLEHPGMNGGNTLENFYDVASRYMQEIRLIHPDRPCILIGNCSGALAAFELARLLVSEGRSVQQVFLTHPPNVGEQSTRSKTWWRWQRLKENLLAVGELRGVERLNFLRNRLRLIWELVDSCFSKQPDLPLSQERVYEASRSAVRNYSARPFTGEVTIVLGMRNVLWGWQSVCAIPPKVCRFYGSSYRKDRYPPINGDPGGHIREYLEHES